MYQKHFLHGSKNIRLPDYDYCNGYFFITNQKDKFGPPLEGNLKKIIEDELKLLETNNFGAKIDSSVIMPTHIHLILCLDQSLLPLSELWRRFKAVTTLKCRREGLSNRESLWQRNFFEHVIRNEVALDRIRKYILQNPIEEKIPLAEIYI